jgi:hypothetical protein
LGILQSSVGIGWMNPTVKNPRPRLWRLLLTTRLIRIGTSTLAQQITSPAILIVWLFVSATMVERKSMLAIEQVCVFRILVILQLIRLFILLHCVIFFMFLTLPSILFLSTNFLVIMMSLLNIILDIFLLRIAS